MKINMKRRLQIQFVLLSVAALVLLQGFIVGFNIFRNYRQMVINADRLILLINTSPDSPEIGDARYFRVSYNLADKTFEVDLTHTSLVTQSTAMEYAKDVIDNKSDSGYVEHYRYLVHRGQDGIHITFLSRYEAMEAFQNNTETLILISVGGIAVMAIVLTILSAKVVSPLVKNHQRQKEFITSASHELKTPLTAISTSADVLAIELTDDEWVHNIQVQAGRLSKLITNLVTLSRLDEEDPFPVRAEFSLSDALWEITEPFVSLAQAKGKYYTQKIADDLTITGDRASVQQMVSILLDNALKYSPDGGHITLTAQHCGRKVEITVSNTIDATQCTDTSRLFDRFYRADESHSNTVSGTGIGLSIAQATVQAHGGKISVKQSGDTILFQVLL